MKRGFSDVAVVDYTEMEEEGSCVLQPGVSDGTMSDQEMTHGKVSKISHLISSIGQSIDLFACACRAHGIWFRACVLVHTMTEVSLDCALFLSQSPQSDIYLTFSRTSPAIKPVFA